jgi:hypothetical protein
VTGRSCRQPSSSYSMREPVGGRGGWSRLLGLHFGQGIPAPPQLQACSPPHGVSGWFSQTNQRPHKDGISYDFIRLVLSWRPRRSGMFLDGKAARPRRRG